MILEILELNEAVVLIGDQCFEYEKSFRFKIDLAGEWKEFSGLPFVFACWTANRKLDDDFIEEFNNALVSGVNNIDAVVEKFGKTGTITGEVLRNILLKTLIITSMMKRKKLLKYFLI